jgi:leader peptidase (prepilin peptidase)/N-methyltransferase
MDILAFLQQNTAAFAAVAFVLSLLVGSFLNVVIYRLPLILEREWQAQCAEMAGQPAPPAGETLTLATPRSYCPACKAPVKALHNIPVVSWLALRGRCAHCGARIPARYPVVELATGVLSAVDALSSLLEPLIMVILGVLVGGLVIAMYLPIFKLGAVI